MSRAVSRSLSAAAVQRHVKSLRDTSRASVLQRFFKTAPGQYGAGDRFLGIRVPVLRQLSRAYQDLSLHEVASLLRSPWHEERLLALLILVRQYGRADAAQRDAIYRLYLESTTHINNWDLIDCSAEQIVGAHLRDRSRSPLRRLARAKRWSERRIAIMATFHYIKRGECTETLTIARLLLDDEHDLIHKAVGWMLREIGNRDRAVEEEFLRQHAGRMPRTMLRYAIERFPEELRRRYLASRFT
ncbi:MAG: DNA alkylation repair protein [Luteitalea sp.]|nr:DNA alkylation repair protein [Luteitalea sp.]